MRRVIGGAAEGAPLQPPAAARRAAARAGTRLSHAAAWPGLAADALYAQRLTADTVEVSPRQLWRLLRQQQRAQASPGACTGLYGKSVIGLPLFSEG